MFLLFFIFQGRGYQWLSVRLWSRQFTGWLENASIRAVASKSQLNKSASYRLKKNENISSLEVNTTIWTWWIFLKKYSSEKTERATVSEPLDFKIFGGKPYKCRNLKYHRSSAFACEVKWNCVVKFVWASLYCITLVHQPVFQNSKNSDTNNEMTVVFAWHRCWW